MSYPGRRDFNRDEGRQNAQNWQSRYSSSEYWDSAPIPPSRQCNDTSVPCNYYGSNEPYSHGIVNPDRDCGHTSTAPGNYPLSTWNDCSTIEQQLLESAYQQQQQPSYPVEFQQQLQQYPTSAQYPPVSNINVPSSDIYTGSTSSSFIPTNSSSSPIKHSALSIIDPKTGQAIELPPKDQRINSTSPLTSHSPYATDPVSKQNDPHQHPLSNFAEGFNTNYSTYSEFSGASMYPVGNGNYSRFENYSVRDTYGQHAEFPPNSAYRLENEVAEEDCPPPLEEMDAEFLQKIIDCIITADASNAEDSVTPFHADDSTLYVFSIFYFNNGENRYYDGTINEIWKQLFKDVKDTMQEATLADDCLAMVSGEKISFELLLTEAEKDSEK